MYEKTKELCIHGQSLDEKCWLCMNGFDTDGKECSEKNNMESMYIGLDFDGTVVYHKFPKIGRPIPHAIETLKMLQEKGHKIILNTMRSDSQNDGPVLTEAVEFLKKNGINLYGVNCNPDQKSWTSSPKVYAHFYIDDAAVGCPLIVPDDPRERPYVDWLEIQKLLKNLL